MRHVISTASLLLLPFFVAAQSLGTRAVTTAGGMGTGADASLSWSVGQPASGHFNGTDTLITAGVQQPDGVLLELNIAVLLDGPYDTDTELMHDSLRVLGLVPTTEPFTVAGRPPVGMQGGAALGTNALLASGSDAVVDWIFLELRAADDNSRVVAARSALVQRDGDVVDMDGGSPVRITVLPGNYHLAVLHRNHLPVMSQAPLAFNAGPNAIDLTEGTLSLHVPNAQVFRAGHYLLWQGDVSGDAKVQYIGQGNDRDPILVGIGGTVPTNSSSGYLPTDVNMDGSVKYVGQNNDRDPILQTIGGSVPTAVRTQPLP